VEADGAWYEGGFDAGRRGGTQRVELPPLQALLASWGAPPLLLTLLLGLLLLLLLLLTLTLALTLTRRCSRVGRHCCSTAGARQRLEAMHRRRFPPRSPRCAARSTSLASGGYTWWSGGCTRRRKGRRPTVMASCGCGGARAMTATSETACAPDPACGSAAAPAPPPPAPAPPPPQGGTRRAKRRAIRARRHSSPRRFRRRGLRGGRRRRRSLRASWSGCLASSRRGACAGCAWRSLPTAHCTWATSPTRALPVR
jgi:hypothetical protein